MTKQLIDPWPNLDLFQAKDLQWGGAGLSMVNSFCFLFPSCFFFAHSSAIYRFPSTRMSAGKEGKSKDSTFLTGVSVIHRVNDKSQIFSWLSFHEFCGCPLLDLSFTFFWITLIQVASIAILSSAPGYLGYTFSLFLEVFLPFQATLLERTKKTLYWHSLI